MLQVQVKEAIYKEDYLGSLQDVMDVYIFSVFCVEVLIIRYDKMVSHMMPNMCMCICHKRHVTLGRSCLIHYWTCVCYDWSEHYGCHRTVG
jgi:hypothetical protein